MYLTENLKVHLVEQRKFANTFNPGLKLIEIRILKTRHACMYVCIYEFLADGGNDICLNTKSI